jgi:hypothetical protein
MSFTREELEGFYKSQLCNLAGYYSIDVNMRMLKEEIIAKILEETEMIEKAKEPQMSVRIQRIKEQNE